MCVSHSIKRLVIEEDDYCPRLKISINILIECQHQGSTARRVSEVTRQRSAFNLSYVCRRLSSWNKSRWISIPRDGYRAPAIPASSCSFYSANRANSPLLFPLTSINILARIVETLLTFIILDLIEYTVFSLKIYNSGLISLESQRLSLRLPFLHVFQ